MRPPLVNEAGLTKRWDIDSNGTVVLDESGPPYFYILEGSPWSYADDIGKAISSLTLGIRDNQQCNWEGLSIEDQSRISSLDAWMEAYLAGGITPDYRTDAPADVREAWRKGRDVAAGDSLADQFRWAQTEMSDLRGRHCKPQR